MPTYRTLRPVRWARTVHPPGSLLDLPEHEAAVLQRGGLIAPAPDPVPEPKPARTRKTNPEA